MDKTKRMYAILMFNFCRRQLNAAARKVEFSDALGTNLLAAVRKEEEAARLAVIRSAPESVSVNMQKALEARRALDESITLAKKWRDESRAEWRERCLKIRKIKFLYIEYTPCRRLRCILRAH